MTSTRDCNLRFLRDGSRYFLIPTGQSLPRGDVVIVTLAGEEQSVSLEALTGLEISEDQARRWAKEELSQTLDELKHGIDEKLTEWRQTLDEFNRTPVTKDTTVTPNAASAFFDLLKQLPRVIGNSLSTDERRVESAKNAMADLQQRLKDAGIDLDDRFTNFPDRLAELRKDFDQQRRAKKTKADSSPPDKP